MKAQHRFEIGKKDLKEYVDLILQWSTDLNQNVTNLKPIWFEVSKCRPAYLYRFSRDIPILALNHDFPISFGGVPILEDAGIFRARRFRFVLFSPVFTNPPRILHLPPVKALRCRYK